MVNKKNFNGQKKVKNNSSSMENSTKRFSKAKFKKENGSMSVSETAPTVFTEERWELEGKKTHGAQYYLDKAKENERGNCFGTGKEISVNTMMLTEPSIAKVGFSVIPKGQCVKVISYQNGEYRKVIAQDGRIGLIGLTTGAKKLSFAV